MKKSDYVIVGANVAAVGAIEGIRRYDIKSSILTISYETLGSYSKAMLAGYIEGATSEWIEYRGKEYFDRMGVECLYGRRATRLDVEKLKLFIEGGEEVKYKKLLLAAGGVPFKPAITGAENKDLIFSFTEFMDAHKIREALPRFDSVLVIGAGFTGTEIAYTLNKLNKRVTVVELGDRVLVKALDHRSSGIVESLMREEGIDFYLNDTVEEISGKKEITGVKLKSGKFIPCQAVITAIGVIPNGQIIQDTPLKFDRGLEVDEFMRTNIPDVYGAGDVVKAIDITDGQKRSLPIWPLAYQQGIVAGSNMAGTEYPYAGGLPMNSLKFLKLPVLSAGITTPPGPDYEDYEVVYIDDSRNSFYRSLVLKDGRLKGFVTVGAIDGAGILTGLIKSKIDIKDFKESLLYEKRIGMIRMPREWRNNIFLRRDETDYYD